MESSSEIQREWHEKQKAKQAADNGAAGWEAIE